MDNADIEALTQALRLVQTTPHAFVLTVGDPVLHLYRPIQTPLSAWSAVRRAHPKATGAILGTVEVVRGTVHLTWDPALSQGTPSAAALKASMEAVRKAVQSPLLTRARVRMRPPEPEVGAPVEGEGRAPGEDVGRAPGAFRMTGEDWIAASGGPGRRSDELQALDQAVAAIADNVGRRDTIRLVAEAKLALARWLSRKSEANPRLPAARRLKAELDEAERLARLQLATDLFRRNTPDSLPEILSVLASVQEEGGRVGKLRDEMLARVVRRIARYDAALQDDDTAGLLFDCAERVRRIGGAAVGNALDGKMPNTLARVEAKVERAVADEKLERARTEGEARRQRTEAELDAGQLTLGDQLGRGNFGSVHELVGGPGDMRVCAKFPTGTNLDEARHEAEVYRQIHDRVGTHPNIGACFGVRPVPNRDGVETEALVMEMHTGGSVEKRLNQARIMLANGRLSQAEYHDFMKGLFRGVVRGLVAVRDAGFGHCDIKADNLMIGEDGEAKLVDMGLATTLGDASQNAFFGHYQSLESSEARDVFAVGATVFKEILGKQFVYNAQPGQDPRQALAEFANRGDQATVDAGKNPTAFTDFVNAILRPGAQPTLEELLDHPFLRDGQPRPEVLQKIIAQPMEDPTADDLARYEAADVELWRTLEGILAEPDTRLGELAELARRAAALEASFKREFPFADEDVDEIEDLLKELAETRKGLSKLAANFRGFDPALLVFDGVYGQLRRDLKGNAEAHVEALRTRLVRRPSPEEQDEIVRGVLERLVPTLAAPDAEGLEDRLRRLADARVAAFARLKPFLLPALDGAGGLTDFAKVMIKLMDSVTQLDKLAKSLRSDAPPSNRKLKAELTKIARRANTALGARGALAEVRQAWVAPIAELALALG